MPWIPGGSSARVVEPSSALAAEGHGSSCVLAGSGSGHRGAWVALAGQPGDEALARIFLPVSVLLVQVDALRYHAALFLGPF